MLKLVLALPNFYPTFAGGPLRFMRYQPGLRKRNVQARVLAGTPRTKDDSHFRADLAWSAAANGSMLPIEHVEGMPVHRVRLPQATSMQRTACYFRALIALCQNPATRPDLIQLHSFERIETLYWLFRLKRLGIPILYAIQIARPTRHRSKILQRAEDWMLRRFYDHFDGIVTNSDAISAHVRALGVKTPIAVISNGVDLETFRPCHHELEKKRARRAVGVDDQGPVILSVGAICPRKGSDLLVTAWTSILHRMPKAQLVLVGPRHDLNNSNLSQFRARLKMLIQESPYPERIHLTGVRNDMNEVYAAADIIVLPSSREGMPNAVLEAMACERPVLLTPFDGQSTTLGRPGIEFEQVERNVEALSNAMLRMLNDPTLCAERVRNGKAWIRKNLNIESSLNEFSELYQLTASGARGDLIRLDTHRTRAAGEQPIAEAQMR